MSGMDVDDAQSDQPPRLSWQTANPDHTSAGSGDPPSIPQNPPSIPQNPPSIPQNPPNNSIPEVITANYAQISRGWQAFTGSVAGTLRNFTQEPAQEPPPPLHQPTSPPHQIQHDTLNINPAQSHPPALDHGKRQRVEEDEDTAGGLSPEQAPSSSSKVRLVAIDDLTSRAQAEALRMCVAQLEQCEAEKRLLARRLEIAETRARSPSSRSSVLDQHQATSAHTQRVATDDMITGESTEDAGNVLQGTLSKGKGREVVLHEHDEFSSGSYQLGRDERLRPHFLSSYHQPEPFSLNGGIPSNSPQGPHNGANLCTNPRPKPTSPPSVRRISTQGKQPALRAYYDATLKKSVFVKITEGNGEASENPSQSSTSDRHSTHSPPPPPLTPHHRSENPSQSSTSDRHSTHSPPPPPLTPHHRSSTPSSSGFRHTSPQASRPVGVHPGEAATVHPPYDFHRFRSGFNPSAGGLRLPTPPPSTPPPETASTSSSDTSIIMALHKLEDRFDNLAETLQYLKKPERKPAMHGYFTKPKVVNRKPQSVKDFQDRVRHEMRVTFGIKNDSQILDAVTQQGLDITPEEVALARKEGTAPTLDPIRICWFDLKSWWNEEVGLLFAKEMRKTYPEYNEEDIRNQFFNRLTSMHKKLNNLIPKPGGPSTEEIRAASLKSARQRSRMNKIFSGRNNTATILADSAQNPMYSLVAEMVSELGIDGMSSDESDTDDFPNSFNVSYMPWRSFDVNQLLTWLDKSKNRKNIYGNVVSGARPVKRNRPDDATSSRRPAKFGLPRNFYNDHWYNQLTPSEQRQLSVLPAVVLPKLS